MRRKKSFFLLAGTVLLFLCIGFFLFQSIYTRHTSENAKTVAAHIQTMLPPRSVGIEEVYTNRQMPVLQFEGNDYVCLLEIPSKSICLPVENIWSTSPLCSAPCRFWGSCYDGSLILGNSGFNGQFDFCGQLDLGEPVTITDMDGSVFTYCVERIDRAPNAQFETLSDPEYALTLFVQETYSTQYIIVRCNPTA